ncbi:hypothetical protein Ahy_A03g013145 [Arachis hypogaea]|uniref:Uncharacterized protein n=1 Tax=Arachis hypogaea TaxID=3818 RepID=A0A445DUR8_ARAHY|nr:hypothetical protein Ahy_A03g013145 [Arachis hypogaea]
MKDGKCTKFYPKRFVDQTRFDEDGYPIYRRHNMRVTVKINNVDIDNRFVVPYNLLLLTEYQAHINLEFCKMSNAIEYLFKYVNKGSDQVNATVGDTYQGGQSSEVVDEVKQYYDCLQKLTFRLPNQQHVVFDDANIIIHVYLRNKDLVTMFMGSMIAHRRFPEGWALTYVEYP